MNTRPMTRSQANLELFLLSTEADSLESGDWYAWLRDSGLPSEAAIRLKGLIAFTVAVGERLVSIGKIVLFKIIEFIKAHPHMAAGIALGAAISALVSMIPFLGPWLWPIVAVPGVSLGAFAGHLQDKAANGNTNEIKIGLITVTQEVIEIAKLFFELLIDIVCTALDEKTLRGI